MPLTEREKITRDKYDVSAEDWLAHSGGRNRACFWAEEMRQFVEKLRGKKVVLEVGCGPATDGNYLTKIGAKVISTDYSKAMLALAAEINPKAKLIRADMQEMCFRDNSFDGFWATASLLHLENPNKALSELVRVTKKNGIGFITVKEGEGESVDPRTNYYFRYYSNKDFTWNLRYMDLETITSGRKAGSPGHDWLTYLVRVIK